MTSEPANRPLDPGLHADLKGKLDYAKYLQLDRVLSSQAPLAPRETHDELLFIIQHQTSELWLKLMIHELRAAVAQIEADRLETSFKILARVKNIQTQLISQWDVLATLTPNDYAQFRPYLGPSSGFQSYQNRLVEFLLGGKEAGHLRFFEHRPEVCNELRAALEGPSIYDAFLGYLARRGHAIPEEVLRRDRTRRHPADARVVAALKRVYEDPGPSNWDAYEMAEKLLDVDERHALWRYRHYLVVRRIIGMKRGTGGSSGAGYLRDVVDDLFFPDLWEVRTVLGA